MSESNKLDKESSTLDGKFSQGKSQKHGNNGFIKTFDFQESNMDNSDEAGDEINEHIVNKDISQAQLYTNLLFPYANCLKEICDNTELDSSESDEAKSKTKLFDQLSREQILYPYACLLQDLHNIVQGNASQPSKVKMRDHEVADVMKDIHFQNSLVKTIGDNDMDNIQNKVDTSYSDTIKGIYMQNRETLNNQEPQSLYNSFNGIGKILASTMPQSQHENPSHELQTSAFLQQISLAISEGKDPSNVYEHQGQLNSINFSNLSGEKFGDTTQMLSEQNSKNVFPLNSSEGFSSENDDDDDVSKEITHDNRSALKGKINRHFDNGFIQKSRRKLGNGSHKLSQIRYDNFDQSNMSETTDCFVSEEENCQVLQQYTDEDHYRITDRNNKIAERIAARSSSLMADVATNSNTGKIIFSQKRGKPQNTQKRKMKLDSHSARFSIKSLDTDYSAHLDDIEIKEENIKEESVLQKDDHFMNASVSNFANKMFSNEGNDQESSKESNRQYYAFGNKDNENQIFNPEMNTSSIENSIQTSDSYDELQDVSVNMKRYLKESITIQDDIYRKEEENLATGMNSLPSMDILKSDKDSTLLQEYLSGKDQLSINYKDDTSASGSILQKYLQRNGPDSEDKGNDTLGSVGLSNYLDKKSGFGQENTIKDRRKFLNTPLVVREDEDSNSILKEYLTTGNREFNESENEESNSSILQDYLTRKIGPQNSKDSEDAKSILENYLSREISYTSVCKESINSSKDPISYQGDSRRKELSRNFRPNLQVGLQESFSVNEASDQNSLKMSSEKLFHDYHRTKVHTVQNSLDKYLNRDYQVGNNLDNFGSSDSSNNMLLSRLLQNFQILSQGDNSQYESNLENPSATDQTVPGVLREMLISTETNAVKLASQNKNSLMTLNKNFENTIDQNIEKDHLHLGQNSKGNHVKSEFESACVDDNFECQICHLSFSNGIDLRNHQVVFHNDEDLQQTVQTQKLLIRTTQDINSRCLQDEELQRT